ncbi:MAG: CNP1-like family protein [Neisseria sp.]|nr:CNP1-like family protein [Neisseria sp.]
MRLRFLPGVLCLAASVQASDYSLPAYDIIGKNSSYNTRYVETERDRAFEESELALPGFPDRQTSWLEIEVADGTNRRIAVSEQSIALAPDRTVRYLLNIRSAKGSDNISAEALYCSPYTLSAKPSSYKIYAYGDSTGKRWIPVRRPEWKNLGTLLNSEHSVRSVIYQAWCVDGLPGDTAGLVRRLKERAGNFPVPGKLNRDKK